VAGSSKENKVSGFKDLRKRAGVLINKNPAAGKKAVEMAGNLRLAMVLMDIMMAGQIDGINAARSINETEFQIQLRSQSCATQMPKMGSYLTIG
jgi:DNA-binding NarL/FixJ family response regulator